MANVITFRGAYCADTVELCASCANDKKRHVWPIGPVEHGAHEGQCAWHPEPSLERHIVRAEDAIADGDDIIATNALTAYWSARKDPRPHYLDARARLVRQQIDSL